MSSGRDPVSQNCVESADPLAPHQTDFGGRAVVHHLYDRHDPGARKIHGIDAFPRLVYDEIVGQLNRPEVARKAPARLLGKTGQDVVLNVDDLATLTERMKPILCPGSRCPT